MIRPGPKGGCSPCGCTGPPKFWGPKNSSSPLSSIATCLLSTCPNVQMLKLKPMTRPAHDFPVPTTACSLSRLFAVVCRFIFWSSTQLIADCPTRRPSWALRRAAAEADRPQRPGATADARRPRASGRRPLGQAPAPVRAAGQGAEAGLQADQSGHHGITQSAK